MKKLSLSLMLNVSLALMLALSLIYPQSVAVSFVATWAILATVICVVAGGVGVYATEYVLERYGRELPPESLAVKIVASLFLQSVPWRRRAAALVVMVSDSRLLPTGSSPLEVAAAKACAEIEKTPVSIRELWNPDTCPANLLPWLAWSFSVDRWDDKWPEATKRAVIRDAYFIHCHKGTIGAIRRVVEPLGYLIEVREWWQLNEEPGTFRIVVGVLEQGITEEMYQELERLVADAKPASRHLTGLAISLSTTGNIFAGAGCYHGDALTVYPYTPEAIIVGGDYFPASAIHLIDNLRVNA